MLCATGLELFSIMPQKSLDLYVLLLIWNKVNHRLRFLCSVQQTFFLVCTILVYLTFLQPAILLCPLDSLCSAVLTWLNSLPSYWHKFCRTWRTESIKSLLSSRYGLLFPNLYKSIATLQDLFFIQVDFGLPHLHGLPSKEHNIQRYIKKKFISLNRFINSWPWLYDFTSCFLATGNFSAGWFYNILICFRSSCT